MCPEEIAQTDERSNSFDIGGWLSVFDSLQFVFSWFDTFWRECETQVRDFLVAEKAFVEVDLQVMGMQSLQNLFQNYDMIFVCVCVYQKVVNVDNDVGDVA